MAVTMQKIADEAGVNIATVSIVLNNRPMAQKFLPETRKRVWDVARKLNYRSSFLGQSLATGKTSTLAMFCGGINRPHFAELADVALQEARQRGYQLLISVTQWNREEEENCLRMLMSRRVDGVLMQLDCIRDGSELYSTIKQTHFPVVLLNCQTLKDIHSVQSDFVPGTRQAVECLAQRGHKTIHMLAQKMIDDDFVDPKLDAFYKACRDLGVEPSVSYIGVDVSEAERAGARVAAEGHRALIVYCDYMSVSVMRGLQRAGKRVPDDMDLIGTCGTEWAAMYQPSLASIAIDRRKLVSLGMDLMLEKIENREGEAQHLTIPTHFRTGRSVMGLPDPILP